MKFQGCFAVFLMGFYIIFSILGYGQLTLIEYFLMNDINKDLIPSTSEIISTKVGIFS